jgi:hypothetical protein
VKVLGGSFYWDKLARLGPTAVGCPHGTPYDGTDAEEGRDLDI